MFWLSAAIQERLAYVLAHFVWQGIALAALLALVVSLCGIKRPQVRYGLSLITFLLMTACPIVTWSLAPEFSPLPEPLLASAVVADFARTQAMQANADIDAATFDASNNTSEFNAFPPNAELRSPAFRTELSQESIVAPSAADQSPSTPADTHWIRHLRPYETWIIGAWLSGVGLLSLRLLCGAIGLWRWRRAAESVPEWLLPIVARLCESMSMWQPSVRVCRRLTEAVALGLFKPMILLPAAWLTELPPDMLEAVLAHELAHIRRLDLWVNLFQRLVETVLFYHPAVWWLSRRLRMERELCCDECAANLMQDRVRYAEMLEQVARMSRLSASSNLSLAVGIRDGHLLQRVRHILEPAPQRSGRSAGLAGLLSLACVLAVSVSIGSQTQIASPDARSDDVAASEQPEPTATVTDAAVEPESAPVVVDLPNGRSFELVGITKNTALAKDGWKPDGTPIGDVGHWPSTIVLHDKGSSSAYAENGSHPKPDADAIDLLVRFRGLKEQPSLTFDMATIGSSYHHLPLKDPYEFRVSTRRRGEPSPGGKWGIPDGEMRVGLTDEPWGKWVQISPAGEVLNPSQPGERHHRYYDKVLIHEVIDHERAPNKKALVLCQPKDASSLYNFEIRGIDEDGKPQWVLEWEGRGVKDTDLKTGNWGLATPEKKPLARYEFRLRPYRHWVTISGVQFAPGKASKIETSVKTIADPDRPATVSDLRYGREIELVGVAHAAVVTPSGTQRKANGWWSPSGAKLEGEPSKLSPLPVVAGPTQKFFEFAFKTRINAAALTEGPPPLVPMVVHGGVWFGVHNGKRLRVETWYPDGFMQHQFLAGFDDASKPGSLAFYYSDQNAENAGMMDLTGKVSLVDDVKPRAKQLLDSIQLAGIDTSPTETHLKLRPNSSFQGALQLLVTAICLDGTTVMPEDGASYERLVFKTGKEVEAFQFTVRPMTHRVDCEDIALALGQACNPRVTVTPLEDCYSITFRKDGRTLGILNEMRPQDLSTHLKLLQPALNSADDELIVESQKASAFEFVERVVKTLKADGWKWPTIILRNAVQDRPSPTDAVKLRYGRKALELAREELRIAADANRKLPPANGDESQAELKTLKADRALMPTQADFDAQGVSEKRQTTLTREQLLARLKDEEAKYARLEVEIETHQFADGSGLRPEDSLRLERLVRDGERSYFDSLRMTSKHHYRTEEVVDGRWLMKRRSFPLDPQRKVDSSITLRPFNQHRFAPHQLLAASTDEFAQCFSGSLARTKLSVIGEERLGQEWCVKLADEESRHMTLWLALEKNLLPIRSERTDNREERPYLLRMADQFEEVKPGLWFPRRVIGARNVRLRDGVTIRTYFGPTTLVKRVSLEPRVAAGLFESLGTHPPGEPTLETELKFGPIQVAVLGAVKEPLGYVFPQATSLKDIVTRAGGWGPQATQRVRVVRARQDQELVEVEVTDPEQLSDVLYSGTAIIAETKPEDADRRDVQVAVFGIVEHPFVAQFPSGHASLRELARTLDQPERLAETATVWTLDRGMVRMAADTPLPDCSVVCFDRGLVAVEKLPNLPKPATDSVQR